MYTMGGLTTAAKYNCTAIVEVMFRGRIMYSSKNKHSYSNVTLQKFQTDIHIIFKFYQFFRTIIIHCSPTI